MLILKMTQLASRFACTHGLGWGAIWTTRASNDGVIRDESRLKYRAFVYDGPTECLRYSKSLS